MLAMTESRPTSVMSLLADQMQLSSINEMHCSISSSAPLHRYSVPEPYFGCLNPLNDITMDPEGRLSNESDLSSPQLPSKRLCHSSNNDNIARPIPIKVEMKSDFDNIHNGPTNLPGNNRHSRMLCTKNFVSIKTPQRNFSNLSIRPIISPHYKKSAFTPTRSLTSPQASSSDYSISPDTDSPIHRPASVTSSGFHDCSEQSLLIDPNYSPDSNQKSTCTSTTNTKASFSNNNSILRCHSQPCDESVARNFIGRSVTIGPNKVCTCRNTSSRYQSQVHASMKRRYPSLSHIRSNSQSDSCRMQNGDSPTHQCHCNEQITNSADTSPNACGAFCAIPKRGDGFFFGSGRSYLISLPRIASSPPPTSLQMDSQNIVQQVPRQRIGSNSSSLSTSTTTETNTPTVTFNGVNQAKLGPDSMISNKGSAEDVDMDDSLQENRSTVTFKSECQCYENQAVTCSDLGCVPGPGLGSSLYSSSCSLSGTSDLTTTKSYSTNSNGTNISHSIDSESSQSELREPDDPPEIGFCFSELNSASVTIGDYEQQSASFQELDLDQIELD